MRSLREGGLETALRLEAFITSDSVLDIKDFTYHVSLDKSPREQVIYNRIKLTTVSLSLSQDYPDLGANPDVTLEQAHI